MNVEAPRTFVDTNILLYAYDRASGDKHLRAKALLAGLWQSGRGCLSVQVLQEFYVVAARKLQSIPTGELDAAMRDFAAWKVHRPTERDVLNAIDLHRRHQLSFWDAMIVHSAAALRCPIVWSEDFNAGQRIGNVQIENPLLDSPSSP